MDVEQFWLLNENLPPENAAEILAEKLSKLPLAEIESYQAHFRRFFASAYTWDLWGAAYIIEGGCSDDAFMDFRYGLISRGRSIYESAIAHPDSLVNIADDSETGFIPNEAFGYTADRVYLELSGRKMPEERSTHPSEPEGETWDFDSEVECSKRLPNLYAKFG